LKSSSKLFRDADEMALFSASRPEKLSKLPNTSRDAEKMDKVSASRLHPSQNNSEENTDCLFSSL
jgi:hypothetical protein